MKRWMLTVLALGLTLFLAACALSDRQEEQAEGFLIYYLDSDEAARGGDAIRGVREELDLPEAASLKERAAAVVKQMMQKPEGSHLQSPLPANAELVGVTIQGRRAVVDFSAGFDRLSSVELTLANCCLVLSLSELEGISAVSVTVQGRPVVQQPKQIFYEWDVLLSDMDDVLQAVDVTLYFVNESGALTGEQRTLEVYEGQTVAENLVLELLKGPESRALTAVIPEDFLINSVRVDSGICYVNLSAASLDDLPEDENRQMLMLWSLADSLYSMESVEELRLLADGVELNYFGSIPVETVAVRPQG